MKVLLHMADGTTGILVFDEPAPDPLQEWMTIEGGVGGCLKEKRGYKFRLRHLGGVYPISAEYDEVLGPPRPPTGSWPGKEKA